MAFESLYEYTDFLVKEYEKVDSSANEVWILLCLIKFSESLPKKFVSQKKYALEMVKRLNPSFYDGYFSPRKKT
jgi:hypothetical protein